jgi:hypothetical protein
MMHVYLLVAYVSYSVPYDIVSQSVVRGSSPGGRQAVSKRKHCRTCIRYRTDEECLIHVCDKIAFVGWPSTESSSFCNFLPYNHYFRKYFKLVYKYVTMVTNHWYNVLPMHLRAFSGVGNFTKVVRVCAERL